MNNLKKITSILVLCVITGSAQTLFAQPSVTNSQVSGQVTENNIENLSYKKFSSKSNNVSLTYIEDSLNKTNSLIQTKKYLEAKTSIESLVSWLEDMTEYHTNLYKALKDIDTAKNQADLERELALKSAILRDKAIYQLSMLYIQENKLQKAVPGLVDVVRSQPKTQLGFDAYEALQKIGFTYKVQLSDSEANKTGNMEIQK